jgi:hypothetical protein
MPARLVRQLLHRVDPATLRVALLLSLLVAGTSQLLRPLAEQWSQRQHLGAEYYNVARALADGRGFCDPFGEPTGPTAWVSPLYPSLLAALLLTLGKKSLVASFVVWLTNLSIVAGGVTVYSLARRSCQRVSPLLPLAFYVAWVGSFYYWFFLLTSDIWLLTLVGIGMLWTALGTLESGSARPLAWGAWGGLAGVVSPALAIAWSALGFGLWLKQRRETPKWLLAAALMASAVAPWTLRNAIVFGELIPVKANLGYEQFQANVVDSDGVYDVKTFEQHPYNRLLGRFEYAKLGERRYIEEHRRLFAAWAREHPRELARKIANRVAAASVRFVPLWTMRAKTAESRAAVVSQLLLPIPTLLLLLGLVARGRHHVRLLALGAFYLVYLGGYLAFAFYQRFSLPLTPLVILLGAWGLDDALGALHQRRQRPSAAGAAESDGAESLVMKATSSR